VSFATGHVEHDGGDPPKGTKMMGDIVVGYAGGCIVSGTGGTASAGVSVELRATRK
jgi:hypothetical protein